MPLSGHYCFSTIPERPKALSGIGAPLTPTSQAALRSRIALTFIRDEDTERSVLIRQRPTVIADQFGMLAKSMK
ncbi:hypothetical protein E1297_01320 [Roseibium sp. RKSG952]|nr:hypothetical protein [Roseibium sp. RKSG952]